MPRLGPAVDTACVADWIGGYCPSVPRRCFLIRLTVPLLKSVEYLDRVLAGCCWEVLISGKDPDDSIGALRQAAKSLTLTLASYLADFVAETLQARAGLAIATKKFLQLVETKKAPN